MSESWELRQSKPFKIHYKTTKNKLINHKNKVFTVSICGSASKHVKSTHKIDDVTCKSCLNKMVKEGLIDAHLQND